MSRSSSAGHLEYNSAWCKDCGICAAFCPKAVLELVHGSLVIKNEEACIGCNMCGRLCPDYAIYYVKEGIK